MLYQSSHSLLRKSFGLVLLCLALNVGANSFIYDTNFLWDRSSALAFKSFSFEQLKKEQTLLFIWDISCQDCFDLGQAQIEQLKNTVQKQGLLLASLNHKDTLGQIRREKKFIYQKRASQYAVKKQLFEAAKYNIVNINNNKIPDGFYRSNGWYFKSEGDNLIKFNSLKKLLEHFEKKAL